MLTATVAGLRTRWRRLLLSALAVALGTAFAAGTLIYTDTVNAAYFAQFAVQAKNVDAAVEPAGGALLPASDLAAVRATGGVAAVEGRLSGSLPMVGASGRAYAGIAIDRAAYPRFRAYTVLSGEGSVLLDEDTAALNHVTAGKPVTVIGHDGRPHRLTVTGIVDVGISPDARAGSVLILPAPVVRTLTGTAGYQRIDVAAAPGVSQPTLAARLAGLRLPGVSVITGGQLAVQLAEQTAGGQSLLSTGLLIFSLVSLLVTALVIYNSFRMLLAQRWREVALLRCVGATRRQVIAGVVAESLVMGLVASIAGTGVAVTAVAALNSGAVSLSPLTVLLSLALGTVVTVGAALLPAVAASRTAPAAAMQVPLEARVRGRGARITAAVVLGGIGLALTAAGIPDGKTGLLEIAAGGTLFFLGFLAIGPLVAGPLATGLGWLPARLLGVQMRLAITGARRNPSRTAATTVALTTGIGLMTLFSVVLSTASQFAVHETSRHYPADYLLSAQQTGIPASVVASLRASARITATAGIRQRIITLNGHQVSGSPVIAVEPAAYRSMFMPLLSAGSLSSVQTGTGGIALNGEEASELHVAVGGSVWLAGRSFRVVAIFAGSVVNESAVISWADFGRAFGPGEDSAVLVKAAAGVSLEASAAVVDAAVAHDPMIDVTSEASLRAHVTSSVAKLAALLDGLLAVSIGDGGDRGRSVWYWLWVGHGPGVSAHGRRTGELPGFADHRLPGRGRDRGGAGLGGPRSPRGQGFGH